jgi:hypothetical protein
MREIRPGAFTSRRHKIEYYYGKFIRASTLMCALMGFHLLFPVLSRSAVQEFTCLYRTLTRAEGIWDYQIKGIDSGNYRLVVDSGDSGNYRILRLAETISEMASWRYVG